MAGFGGGIAGLGPTNAVFEPAAWVDKSKQPGHTSTAPRTGQPGWWFSWPKIGIFGVGLPFVYSPNLVWFACAALIYCCFPYDLEAAARWDDTFIMQRLYINLSCGILWYSWWHLSIYYFHFASRKFNPKNNGPTLPRLLHNMWYCVMGLVIWTAVEVTMIHLMGSGKLLYTPNEKLLTREGFSTLWWVLAMPAFRDLHFYFAHRTIHIRVLYTYVHSLHHRNNDPEPFSGLCMHPIEHMYYFSCVGFSFFVVGSPFLVTWNLIHAVLAPAAGHSGYEDHWQSDQFHHLHHQYFECNYGNIGVPFDKWFGTIRHFIGDKASYRGADTSVRSTTATVPHDGVQGTGATARTRTTDTYLCGSEHLVDALPARADHAMYWIFTASMPLVLGLGFKRAWHPHLVAMYTALGPLVAAWCCARWHGDKQALLWPFHKETLAGSLGCHLVLGMLMTVLPVYIGVYLTLSPV
eukprot:m.481822 g.481822  ORF g.481822 m.481822 type:complete len:464 (-) comp21717_c0_seq29:122-1513(-)